MAQLKVKPWRNEPAALAATEATLRALPGGGTFLRDESGEFVVDPLGYLTLECRDPGFVKFAIESQGYAREAVEWKSGNVR